MTRKIRREMFGHGDRPHSGSPATVWNRKGLVQVEMADVRADRRRARQPDLRVHVRAVHVDLAAVLVDDAADFLDVLFEDAVGRRVGDHERRQRLLVLFGLRAKVVQHDVPVAVARHDNDLEPRHRRARRVGSVRGCGNEDDVALVLAAIAMVRANRHEPGELSLRTGIRLK